MSHPLHMLGSPDEQSPRGFTLVELLAAVAIIALLVGILLGITGRLKRKAMDAQNKSQMQQIMLALESYKSDWGYYPVTPCDSPRMIYAGQPYPSPIGTRPYWYYSMMTNGGPPATYGPPGSGIVHGGVTIPCIVSNSAALRRAIEGKYYKSKASQSAPIVMSDKDTGYADTNMVYVDSYTTPWGYFNTTNPDWKARQFNPVGYDLWSYGPYAFSYSFNCTPCGPTGSVTITSVSANPKNAMMANWGRP